MYRLASSDINSQNFAFHEFYEKKINVKDKFKDLVCDTCGKIDEIQALSREIQVDIKSNNDFICLDDGVIVVSAKFIRIVEDNKIKGVNFKSIDRGGKYYTLIADVFASVDLSLAGFVVEEGICSKCDRPYEAVIGPLAKSISSPSGKYIFCTEYMQENSLGRVFWFFVNEEVKEILCKEKLIGLEVTKAW